MKKSLSSSSALRCIACGIVYLNKQKPVPPYQQRWRKPPNSQPRRAVNTPVPNHRCASHSTAAGNGALRPSLPAALRPKRRTANPSIKKWTPCSPPKCRGKHAVFDELGSTHIDDASPIEARMADKPTDWKSPPPRRGQLNKVRASRSGGDINESASLRCSRQSFKAALKYQSKTGGKFRQAPPCITPAGDPGQRCRQRSRLIDQQET